ncbi:AAA family ATPase, partial [Nitrolancea hollandica]|uniref:AAA family ATPase n=1 Tax=Nitrolancea hollandica TaxID=1206749 RepID=UPI00058D1529
MVVPKILRASDIERERIRRLWANYVFLGKVNVFDGDPGLGKSTVVIDIAARVTTFRPMPDGSRSDLEGPASVLILNAEDGAGDTIRNRLEAAG